MAKRNRTKSRSEKATRIANRGTRLRKTSTSGRISSALNKGNDKKAQRIKDRSDTKTARITNAAINQSKSDFKQGKKDIRAARKESRQDRRETFGSKKDLSRLATANASTAISNLKDRQSQTYRDQLDERPESFLDNAIMGKKDFKAVNRSIKRGLRDYETGALTEKGENKLARIQKRNEPSKNASEGYADLLGKQEDRTIARKGLFPVAGKVEQPFVFDPTANSGRGGFVSNPNYVSKTPAQGFATSNPNDNKNAFGPNKPTPSTGDFNSSANRSASALSSSQMSTPSSFMNTPAGGSAIGSDLFKASRMDENSVLRNLLKQYEAEAQQDIDPDAIKRQAIRDTNERVRAYNATRADLLNAQGRENSDRVGTQRALSARSGLLGSDFGQQAMEGVLSYNRELNQEINNAYDEKIQNVLGDAQRFAETEINNLRALKQQGGENYLKAMEIEGELMDNGLLNTVNSMIAQGVSPLDLPQEQLASIATRFKASPDKLISFFTQAVSSMQGEDEMLSISDAEKLGVPYGTTKSQAAAMGLTPGQESLNDPTTRIAKQNTLEQATNALNTLSQISGRLSGALQMGAAARVAASKIPGTDAADLKRVITTLQALLSFDTLQDMRNASKTGGALGQVSERELDLLGSTVANLNIGLSSDILQQNLQYVTDMFAKVQQGAQQDLQETSSLVALEGGDFDW